ncbi:MAG TPA: hypothetical protein VMT23_03905 [Candidatus Binatia bacterium]|nr:hypothetical protein [Candidatus Binatia bacterium]
MAKGMDANDTAVAVRSEIEESAESSGLDPQAADILGQFVDAVGSAGSAYRGQQINMADSLISSLERCEDQMVAACKHDSSISKEAGRAAVTTCFGTDGPGAKALISCPINLDTSIFE